MQTFITKARRQELIDQYIDCHEDLGGDDSEALLVQLNAMNNSELVQYVKDSGWDIL